MKSYQDLLRHVLERGERHADRTGVGTTSVFGHQWRHDMRTGFPLLTTKRVPLRWCFEEVRWMLSGTSRVEPLRAAGVDIWDEWATAEQCAKFGRAAGDLGPIYGPMMRAFPVGYSKHDQTRESLPQLVDQIATLLDDIETSPNSRRLVVTHWHPYYAKRVTLPPCHTLWQVKVHEASDEMSLHLYARSIDAFLGLPFDIAWYALILEMLCAVTGKRARDLIISFGDLHVYDNHRTQVELQLSREPRPLPKLELYKEFDAPQPLSALERLLAIEWRDVKLWEYHPHPAIKAEVAI